MHVSCTWKVFETSVDDKNLIYTEKDVKQHSLTPTQEVGVSWPPDAMPPRYMCYKYCNESAKTAEHIAYGYERHTENYTVFG